MKGLWKQMEVFNTLGSRWKFVGVKESSWKLPHNIFVEAAIDGRNGSFHFHRQCKLQCTSMEALTNLHIFSWRLPLASMEVNLLPPTCMEIFHGSKSTSIDFHGRSMEVYCFHW